MNFEVWFINRDGFDVVYKPTMPIGTRALEIARQQAASKAEPLEVQNVKGEVDYMYLDVVEIVLPWEKARHVAHFDYSRIVEVYVPENSLNQYVDMAWEFEYERDGTLRATPVWEINTEALVSEWQEAGHPLEWTPPTGEEDEIANEDIKASADLFSTITIVGSETFYEILKRMIQDMGYARTLRALGLVNQDIKAEAS